MDQLSALRLVAKTSMLDHKMESFSQPTMEKNGF